MSTVISPGALVAIYERMGRALTGRVAVKLSTGEAGNRHFLSPGLIRELVGRLGGTIVECNTAYEGQRMATEDHRRVAAEHGFTGVAGVDIMDEFGSVSLPFARGKHLREDFVGASFWNYDSWLVLSHFKGHQMAGFGGALKNISIGIGSAEGKAWIHTAGRTRSLEKCWEVPVEQDDFVEAMADAAGAVMEAVGGKAVFINVMNNLSVDCDCNWNPAAPELEDIGVLGSLDPVALDRACVDLIYAADEGRSASLRERMEQQHGRLVLDHAERLGLGRQAYELVMV
jgi:uncharacterized Fe-S center protein